MIYHVTANFRPSTAAKFLRNLTNGTIGDQKPDGSEMVASMERAVVNSDGKVEWSEMCFCKTPLAHERSTVLDTHFDDFKFEEIENQTSYKGRPFMDMLRDMSKDVLAT